MTVLQASGPDGCVLSCDIESVRLVVIAGFAAFRPRLIPVGTMVNSPRGCRMTSSRSLRQYRGLDDQAWLVAVGNGEAEGGAVAGLALNPDAPVVLLDD